MTIEIRVPPLPESVTDATLVEWRKRAGEVVRRDENLADLETDKVMLEIPAPVNGVLREIKVQPGTSVKAGTVLALLDESGAGQSAAPPAAAPAAMPAPAATPAPVGAAPRPAAPAPQAPPGASVTETPRSGPAARRIIEEAQLSAAAITGSAAGGRISKAAALAAAASAAAARAPAAPAPQPAPATAPPAVQEAPSVALPMAGEARAERRVPMTRLRARIAERLVQAQTTQALLTTFNEVDLSAVQQLRARSKESFEKSYGVKLGLMSFFVKATVEALRRFPIVNAAVEGGDIVYHEYFDIGVAVSTERGLMVPVLRDADTLSFAEIEQAIVEYATRARAGSIKLEELTGGTFSITNGGIFGSLLSTPIVNTPQSAILGMHKLQERAVVIDGSVVVRPMMYLAVTYDHRIIDGREAVQFLVAIKDHLEDPGRLLLGV